MQISLSNIAPTNRVNKWAGIVNCMYRSGLKITDTIVETAVVILYNNILGKFSGKLVPTYIINNVYFYLLTNGFSEALNFNIVQTLQVATMQIPACLES